MTLGALRRWLHGLTHRRARLHAELRQSALQRDLSRERLRQVQARLDALQMQVDNQTARRRAQREGRP